VDPKNVTAKKYHFQVTEFNNVFFWAFLPNNFSKKHFVPKASLNL
jgi:hypothetical protein